MKMQRNRIPAVYWICFAFFGTTVVLLYHCSCRWNLNCDPSVASGQKQISVMNSFQHRIIVPFSASENVKADELERLKIRNKEELMKIPDRLQRIKAIVDSLPLEPKWPDKLPAGFEWVEPSPAKEITPQMNNSEAEHQFSQFVLRTRIKCPQPRRFGSAGGGGWHVCFSKPFDFNRPCLVYSIGMGGEWSFDRMVMNSTGCADMAFDPTLGKDNHKPYDLMWYHNTGMAGTNGINSQKWKVRTFGGMLTEMGHTQTTIDILKIDIEYSEWDAFEAMFLEGSLANVKQLMFEYHTEELHKKTSTSTDYAYYTQVFRALDRLGFKYWIFETNPDGNYKSTHTGAQYTCCGNVYFINVKYLL
jgi:hypothetical protein